VLFSIIDDGAVNSPWQCQYLQLLGGFDWFVAVSAPVEILRGWVFDDGMAALGNRQCESTTIDPGIALNQNGNRSSFGSRT
jgi:hypothetical protein